jgi:hypothetical protein
MKVGAFTACLRCGFTPEQPEDLAKSILLSDRVRERADLEEASARLKAGLAVDFDPEAVADWVEFIRANPQDLRMPLGCAIIWYALLVILALLVLALPALLMYFKWWAA